MGSQKSYQHLQTELDEIVLKLQSTELGADEAVKLYENGLKLVKEMEAWLKTAENTITKLKTDLDKK